MRPQVGHLVIGLGNLYQHLVRRRARQPVAANILRVAGGLGPVPQTLDQRQIHLHIQGIPVVARVDLRGEGVEVDAAIQQQVIGLPRHRQQAAFDIRGQRHQAGAQDTALAAAEVIAPRTIQHSAAAVAVERLVEGR